jgi:hypothetical protein
LGKEKGSPISSHIIALKQLHTMAPLDYK